MGACISCFHPPPHNQQGDILEDLLRKSPSRVHPSPFGLPAPPQPTLYSTLSDAFRITPIRSPTKSPFALQRRSPQDVLVSAFRPSSVVLTPMALPVDMSKVPETESTQGFFGVELLLQPNVENIPIVLLVSASRFLSEKMYLEEGVFRLPGSVAAVKDLKLICNQERGRLRCLPSDVTDTSLCSLMKLWLNDLPSPLIPPLAFTSLVTAQDDERLVAEIQKLPEANRKCLQFFAFMLCLVASYSDQNKMTASNLGKVLAPSLLRAPDSQFVFHFNSAVNVTFRLIVSFQDIFGPFEASCFVPEALEHVSHMIRWSSSCREHL
eukprot:c5221_g2_i1.p1 GENE.c5221_g2_i1~~c5221_g2_i1.p1  ORF type:complete len:323 (+),score=53.95 c5221_g2_i1:77-1045(+)